MIVGGEGYVEMKFFVVNEELRSKLFVTKKILTTK